MTVPLFDLWYTIKRISSYSHIYNKKILFLIFLLSLSIILEMIGTTLIGYFLNIIYSQQAIFSKILLVLVFAFILQIIAYFLRYYQIVSFNDISLKITQKLRMKLITIIFSQPINIFNNKPIGQLLSLLTHDIEMIKELYINAVPILLRSIILIIITLITMFLLNYKLACIVLVLFPSLFLIMLLYQNFSIPIIRKLRSYISDINVHLNEIISGILTIQQFNQQKRFYMKFQNINFKHFSIRMKTLHLESFLLRPLINLLFALTLCSTIAFFAFNDYTKIGIGIFYIFINCIGRLNTPIAELIIQQPIIQHAIVAGDRIFSIMDLPLSFYGKDDRILSSGSIKIKNLNFSYKKEHLILKNINLSIKSNNFIGIVGQTGSGKSTLANLILGFYNIDKGKLLLDNRPINTLSRRVLNNGIVMMQQDPVIITDTIFHNITLGRNISKNQVWNILKKIKIASFINSLPNGIFTYLNNNKDILSVGQKQLLSLARVLILTPVIFIFDEPTANIDYNTQQIIKTIIKQLRKKATVIVIAHRFSSIIEADQILILENGNIVECGTHKNLLKNNNYYYKMCKLENIL